MGASLPLLRSVTKRGLGLSVGGEGCVLLHTHTLHSRAAYGSPHPLSLHSIPSPTTPPQRVSTLQLSAVQRPPPPVQGGVLTLRAR
jgi:hypothetical protein